VVLPFVFLKASNDSRPAYCDQERASRHEAVGQQGAHLASPQASVASAP